MGFYDSESVNKVKSQRELEKNKPSNKEFSSQLEQMFGRGFEDKNKPNEQKEQEDNGLDQIKVVKNG